MQLEPRQLLAGTYAATATTFQSIDLQAGQTGVVTVVDGLDDGAGPVNLGTNTFTFYGTTYGGSSLFASTNGLITFGSGNIQYENSDLSPTGFVAQPAIAPYWDDLVTNVNSTDMVLAKIEGNRLIIEWSLESHYPTSPSPSTVTFQAILELNTGARDGTIIFNYVDLDFDNTVFDNGISATVGAKPTDGAPQPKTLVSFNTLHSLIGDSKAILLTDNLAPTGLVLSPTAVNENLPAGTVVGTLSTTDPDPANTFTYSLVGGTGSTDNGSFQIVGNLLQTAASFNFEAKSTYAIRVRTTDQGGLFTEQTFTIQVNNVNEPPTTLNLVGTTVQENRPSGTLVGLLSTGDPDAANTFTYSLVGGTGSTDNGSFQIAGNQLQTTASFNFEAKSTYAIRLRTTDQGGLFTEQTYVIAVIDVNEAPTGVALPGATTSLPENTNTASGINLSSIVVTDDAPGTNVLSLSGPDASSFEIIGSALRLKPGVVLDYEAKSSYSVVVSVDDGLVGSSPDASVSYTLNIADVNEAPTAVTLPGAITSLPENTSTAAAITLAPIVVTDDALGVNVLSLSGPDAAAFEIVGSALRLKAGVVLDFEARSTYSVTVNVNDSSVGATPDAIANYTLSVLDVNEAPTAVSLTGATTSLPENTSTATAIALASIVVTDDALGTNALSLSGPDASSFEIVGSTLRLKAGVVLNYEAKSSYSVTVNVDDGSVGGSPDASVNYTLNVTDVNEAPTEIALSNSSVAENSANALVGLLTGADPDAGTSLTFSLTDNAGGQFQIVGNELRTTGPLDFEAGSSYLVTVQASDGGLTYSETFTITVIDVNEAPTAVVLGSVSASVNENTSTATAIDLTSIAVTDDALGTNVLSLSGPDSSSFEIVGSTLRLKAGVVLDYEIQSSYSVTVNVDDGSVGGSPDASVNYTLTILDINEAPTAVSLSGATTSLQENTSTDSPIDLASIVITDDALGTNVLSLSGADAGFFEIDGSTLRLKAGTALDFEAKSSYSVTISVDDASVGGSPDASVDYTLTILDVNEAPTAVSLPGAITSVDENTETATGIDLSSIVVTDDALGSNVLSLSGTDAASFEIVGSTLRLKAGTVLDFEAKSSYSVTINVDDGSVGGTPDASVSYTLNVNDLNETPTVLSLAGTSVDENMTAGTAVGTFSTTDPDSGNTFTYTLISGTGDTGNGSFAISGNQLVNAAPLNFEAQSSYSVRVRTTDQGGLFTEQTFTISVNDVNEAPTAVILGSATGSVDENTSTATGIDLTSITVIDDALGTNVLSLSGPDASSFEIVGSTLRLRAGVVLNYEGQPSYSVTVNVDDGSVGGTPDASVNYTLSIADVNEAPTAVTLPGAITSIAENTNTTAGIDLSNIVVTDDALGTNALSLSGADASSFEIVGSTLRLKSGVVLDFEAKSTYSVTINVDDSTVGGPVDASANYTLSVLDLNETPTVLALAGATVNENMPAGTTVGTFSTTDPDSGNTFTYTLVSGTGDAGNGSFSISGNQLVTAASLNFEAQSSYSVRVRTTDQGGLFTERTFTITVNDVNEAPTDIALSNSSVAENAANSPVGTLSGTDPDAGTTLTFSLTDTAGGRFQIVGNELRTTGALDFEAGSSYSVTVQASDGSLTYSETFTITVTNVNEAPIAVSQSVSVTEDGAVAITLQGTDPDGNSSSLVYKITSLPTNGTLLKSDGTAVTLGDSFASPPTLTFRPGAEATSSQVTGFSFTVKDSGNLVSPPATIQITITSAAANGGVTIDSAGVVRIGGTSGDDVLLLSNSSGRLQVKLNGVIISNSILLSAISEVRAWVYAGNDIIDAESLALRTVLYGGVGNDTLTGGSADDVIFGGAGDDTITGAAGNDFLSGGAGADRIVGSAGSDVLVASSAGNNYSLVGVKKLLADWAASAISTADDSSLDDSVFSELDFDKLTGSSGADWFIMGTNDVANDYNPKKKDGDLVTYV